VCQFMHQPTTTHWIAIKRILYYLKSTYTHGLFYQPHSLHLEAYSYVDYAKTLMIIALLVAIVFIMDIIPYLGVPRNTVLSHSSTEAKYYQLAYTTVEISWLRSLFKDLSVSLSTPLIWCDNISFISLA